jgi:uncharacterized membrane-anchored protein
MDEEIQRSKVPEVTLVFWIIKILATTLGETGGDAVSTSMNLGYAVSSLIFIVVVLLLVGWRGPLRLLPFYWLTVVAIRAAGTAIGDLVSGRNMLGLPMSTAVTGILFVVLLLVWKESGTSQRPAVATS